MSSDEDMDLTPDFIKGPAVPRATMVQLCKGPKRRDCFQTTLSVDDKFLNIDMKMVLPNDVVYKKAKMALYFDNSTNRAPDIVKLTNNLCQHFFFAPFLHATVDINLKTCVVSKGVYTVHVNVTNSMKKVFGGQFFYGSFRTRTTLLSNDCNIICVEGQFVMEAPRM